MGAAVSRILIVDDDESILKRFREIQPDAASADSFRLRRPVKKYHGDIGIKSSEGNCSTFTARLPVDSRNEIPAGAANDQSL